jgi:hypothetical protein|tara:strand:+ start:369 stop:581 length:213 start_codon:yes stop_codon:yes gene_type:complete
VGDKQMLFNKYDNKVIKITKNDLIKSIKDTGAMDIHLMEPVDKSNVRIAKQELDKLIRNGELSIVIMKKR